MSTFEVKIHQIEVFEHPNADALELAQVGLFRAVVAKGTYRTGDYALYIPEAAVLPEELIEELGLTGRLAGTRKNRVKAIRLRGELSQGIVCRPDRLRGVFSSIGFKAPEVFAEDILEPDWADTLGIVKYEPPIPVHLAGKVRAQTDLLPWIEIENIKKHPGMFEPGEPVYATEKIHGTCCLTTYVRETGEFLVSSKGMAQQGLCLEEESGNTYWRAVRAAGVEEVLKSIADRWNASRVALFGEVFGAGVQDLAYGFRGEDGPQFRAFDLAVETGGSVAWVPTPFVRDTLEFSAGVLGSTPIPVVPILYAGPYDYEALCAVASGDTVVGNGRHLREGVVVRPSMERFHRQSRVIAKFISPAYLTRKGETTEFE
jgi:RNA ligase (TIGR02306 family)